MAILPFKIVEPLPLCRGYNRVTDSEALQGYIITTSRSDVH